MFTASMRVCATSKLIDWDRPMQKYSMSDAEPDRAPFQLYTARL